MNEEFMCADCHLIYEVDESNKDCEGAIVCNDCSDRHIDRCPECLGDDGDVSFAIIAHRSRIHRY